MRDRRPRSTFAAVTALGVAAAFAVAAPVGAVTPDPTDTPDPKIADGTAQRNLDSARDQWRSLGARSYSIRVSVSCFCPEGIRRPRTIVVRRGKPVRPVPEHLRPFATVPRLFATIQDAIDGDVARLTATYSAHGVPKTIYVDQSFSIADEEHGVTVERFKRVR